MKQKVSVRAIIQADDKVLLLKRANGRDSILGRYELPGGKLDYGEQPEDGLRRHLEYDMGVTLRSLQLRDAITYIDHDDRDIQYTFLLYAVSFPPKPSLRLSENYSQFAWWSVDEVHQQELTESAKLLLGISAQQIEDVKQGQVIGNTIGVSEVLEHLITYSDGGSRGNPGPSASGFIIMDQQENVIHQGGLYLGITTNNQAEYSGVRLALEKAIEMGAKTVECRIDSTLVVNQLNGVYVIKNRDLWPVYEQIKGLITRFEGVTFTHVRREYNQLADGMVNKILNAHAEQGGE